MSKIINIAIIGCGRVAGHHARSIAKIPQQARLVAVSDFVLERRETIMKESHVPGYANYNKMLREHPETDVVSVITPSGMHFEHAMDVIQKHRKHVVIEKPIVMRLEQGVLLQKAAKEAGVQIFPVFQYRFNKAVQRVRNAVLSDELGRAVLGTIRLRWCRPQRYYDRDPWRGTFALDGGACTNQGIHHLDLLRYLGGEVKKVNVKMATLGANIEVEDTVTAAIEFENGGLGVIEITTAARPDDFESSISVVGSKGLAMIGGWATNELLVFSPKPEETKAYSEVFPDVYGFGHKEIYLGVHRSLTNTGRPAVEYDDAMKSIRLLQAMYRSNEIEGWVSVADGVDSQKLGAPNEELSDLYRTDVLVKKGTIA